MTANGARLNGERQEYWENFFRASEDPWQYDNPYEKTKYEQTLSLVPLETIGTALELACAEGHFTARLAPRVGRLIAADISPTAVERAQARCTGAANVQFKVLDFLSGDLPGELDLLVCSEVLYFADLDQLAGLPEKFGAALKPGGRLLMAHACTIADERNRTGFDWGDHFGAKRIADTFGECPVLALSKELRTELYRIQLFRRIDPGQDALPPEIIEAAPAASLPAHIEAAIVWGGAVMTRSEARARERTSQVPILMYHSIAESGPPELSRFRVSPRAFREQLRFLRRHGYHSVSLAEWVRHIANREPIPGRPVVITFDDGYRDFVTHAAPLLEAADFRATIFVATAKAGATADWDETSWPPLPLMDWEDLRNLQRRGFEIGSHTTLHTDLRTLSEEEILCDGWKARTVLREQLGCDAEVMALPWGWTDARIRIALARSEFRAAVTTKDGVSSLSGDPLYLPRIEIAGDDDVHSFARFLKVGRQAGVDTTSEPRLAPDVHLELALLRDRLRAAEKEVLVERGRADAAEETTRVERRHTEFAEAEASLQRTLAAAAEQQAGDATRRAGATEERVRQILTHLQAIESSTIWRGIAPVRSWFSTRPRLARAARRGAKLLWWSITLRLPKKVSERWWHRRTSVTPDVQPDDAAREESPEEGLPVTKKLPPNEGPDAVAPLLLTFQTVGASLLSDIPVVVFGYNNMTYLRSMLAQLRARNLSNLIVVDNASSAPEMQEYLDAVAETTKVVRLAENIGPHHIFSSEAAYRWLPDLFCLTDPDLAFNPNLPGNFVEELAELTERFKIGKAGFALDITDRDTMRDDQFEIGGENYRIWEWEEQFWQNEIGTTNGGDPVFRAIIDTTFALYNKRYFSREDPLDGIRVAGRFTCRHLPWYHDHGVPEAEQETYRATQKFSYYMRSENRPPSNSTRTSVRPRFVENDEFEALTPSALDLPSQRGAPSSPMRFQGGDFFRVGPAGRVRDANRGTPLDRPFIDQFIQTHAGDLHGHILEIGHGRYASTYARRGSQIDVLDIDPANGEASIIDYLQSGSKIYDETYDCLILTQVLQFIPDFERAIDTAARALRPGGVLLLTTPGITQAPSHSTQCDIESLSPGTQVSSASKHLEFFWLFFKSGLKRTLSPHFDERKLLLHAHGNAGLAASFLMGLVTDEIPPELFSFQDPDCPIVLTARAVRRLPVPEKLDWKPATANPDVSIIIPMYNAERTIKETLYSVSRQSYDSYEILLVDDGSNDVSRKIVENVSAASHGRLRVLQHADNEKRGVSLSRNLGIEHARGEFLVFLDADDTIHSEKLAHDIEILRSHPEAAAVVGRTLWWWDGSGQRDAQLETVPEPVNQVVHPPELFNVTYEPGCFSPCVHSWMVRKSAIDEIKPFDPSVTACEDLRFFAELTLRFPIYVASTCLCEYRRSEATLWASNAMSGMDAIAAAQFFEWKTEEKRLFAGRPRE